MSGTVERTRTGTAFGGTRGGPVRLTAALLWGQGIYYLVTGVWPLVSMSTFLMITGPKTDHLQSPAPTEADHWLVMTVGVLIAVIGLTLLVAAWRPTTAREVVVLAVAGAAGLTAIDVVYVARQVLPPIYLADAAVEVVFVAAWVAALWRARPR